MSRRGKGSKKKTEDLVEPVIGFGELSADYGEFCRRFFLNYRPFSGVSSFNCLIIVINWSDCSCKRSCCV